MTFSTTLPAFPLLMLNFTTKHFECAVYTCRHDYGPDHWTAKAQYLAHVRECHPAFLLEKDR